jgi:hypothetical protein
MGPLKWVKDKYPAVLPISDLGAMSCIMLGPRPSTVQYAHSIRVITHRASTSQVPAIRGSLSECIETLGGGQQLEL